MNKQVGLIEFVFDSVYIDLQYDEISLTFTAGSVWCLWSFGRLWPVCEFVVVPYVDAVVAVTVMSVLLFVLHECMLRECEDARRCKMCRNVPPPAMGARFICDLDIIIERFRRKIIIGLTHWKEETSLIFSVSKSFALH